MNALSLNNRSVIRISGKDSQHFLQGLITGDIRKTTAHQAIYAALLTPQGKYLFDFFILRNGDDFLFDVEAAGKLELIKKFTFYKLRAEVKIEDLSETHEVWAFQKPPPNSDNEKKQTGYSVYLDPRCPEIGWRGFVRKGAGQKQSWSFEDYEELRLTLGLPDGSRDIEAGKRFILEANFKELNGVDFKKGCYVGQEMTARMNYRGRLKKRLLPVTVAGAGPEVGAPILSNGKQAGHFRSGQGDKAIALIRLEYLDKNLTTEGGDAVTVIKPDWLKGT
ncbi:MAG: folate-binding protein YgfZ [Proteobacteria bacterium]|nr:folate-binding protein YgfZ [Pseudomonadota bacterium]